MDRDLDIGKGESILNSLEYLRAYEVYGHWYWHI